MVYREDVSFWTFLSGPGFEGKIGVLINSHSLTQKEKATRDVLQVAMFLYAKYLSSLLAFVMSTIAFL
jgi:hypothetical protein